MDLPRGDEQLSPDPACRITPVVLAATYQVGADDGVDDSAGLQRAIDHVKSACSPRAGFHRRSLIELPAGRIDLSRQVYVDASFLTLRGQGSGEGGTRLVFRPDLQTRYDQTVNGRWDQESMTAGTAPDIGNGGWIWPGRGMFRVQTREVAARYQDDWELASSLPMRKDLFEGSVNQHWASGFKVAAAPDDPGFSSRKGRDVVRLDAKADMRKFTPGGYVWVGAANSRNFYAQQGITDPSMIEALHMRQEMFRVTRVDAAAKTITLDQQLEWDLPVHSESDGSAPLNSSGTPYASKVTPLKVVEGVGFEDFAFTQDMNGLPKIGGQGTYALTPEQARNNYGNMAPEYAMHGIVFKWAANSWARGLRATMTGSHPIVTEVARNLQIERNSFDGAWNKGKGGNGYLRGSRVWDSLWAHNLSRNLRHFTFQWSAGGNVAFRNDFDSDLNLHGGWEHDNLFEQNTVRVPYEHRSANCTSNCGGEGGEIDEGTWYPIWWAAGPKAGKWAGSSGPQNVFFDNTLIKQSTPGGPFEPYRPYGAQAGTAFQFGSREDDWRTFQPLSENGQGIADWTGRETVDFTGKGVAAFDVGRRRSLFLADTGGELPPREQVVDVKALTWNMNGAGQAGGVMDRYGTDIPLLANESGSGLPRANEVMALQEAGSPTENLHYWNVEQFDQHTYFKRLKNGEWFNPPVNQFALSPTRARNPTGYLTWLNTSYDGATNNEKKINLALWTRRRIPPEDIFVVPGKTTSEGVHTGKSRPALGVGICGVVYFTWHGDASGGGDNTTMLRNVSQSMATAGPNGTPLRWVVLGDYNMEPTDLRTALGTDTGHFEAVGPHMQTRRASGRWIDYAVTPAPATPQDRIVVGQAGRVLSDHEISDHYPVTYDFSYSTTDPSCTTPDPVPKAEAVPAGMPTNLRVASTTKSPVPRGAAGGSGLRALGLDTISRTSRAQHDFEFEPAADSPGYYRVIHRLESDFLSQESGVPDAKVSLAPFDTGDSSLWRVLGMGDGTLTLLNKATGQALTRLARADGDEVVGRDLVGEFDPDQRWFVQDAQNETLDVDEITDGSSTITVRDANPVEGTPLVLEPESDDPGEEFIPIDAGRTGDRYCYYLAHDGLYVNSTGTHPEVGEGNTLTLNRFRPNDDGYLWCTPLADRHSASFSLSQYASATEPLYLTELGGSLLLNRDSGLAFTWRALSG
ncbi:MULTISPECIES: hypothetical protein [unclassified Streptomyces]|uniref:hypothetical protein n=1 Tax=unclassified Streptomyces TaxID=2593676 RepID=UPI0016603353|nr:MULTISPECIES: hypothetical protein [unclassified Streptomyces]